MDLEGRIGAIYGKPWPVTKNRRRLFDHMEGGPGNPTGRSCEPLRDSWYVVRVDSETVTVPLSSLVQVVTVFQLTDVSHEEDGYRIRGASLGGVTHDAHYASYAEVNVQSVRSDIARAMGCPTQGLRCVLPNGEILEDGARGDEALRAGMTTAEAPHDEGA